MRIPEHIIDQVRSQANIVDVISEHVQLRKAGRNYLGLCPFHKEKTPSFNVNSERGIYKCFGCGRAGNAITFVEEHLSLSFPEAVRHLATKLGIVLPDEEEDDPTGMNARRDGARRAMMEAYEFYKHTLESSDGAPVRAFFKKREFDSDVIENFGLCASPPAWDSLLNHLSSRGFTHEHLEDAGLIVSKEDGKTYDRFRGRAMFSLRDDGGRIVGFSARALKDEPNSPKYINSPQSLLFDKSRILYGLDRAKRSISDERAAIIVEGQADVISMHRAGFTSAVASSGTSLTSDQLRLLKRWADTVILVFDADNAGSAAMTRSIELALALGFDIRCVELPQGEDPDSFIRKHGADEMKVVLHDAMPWMTYQTEKYRTAGAFNDPVKQADAVKTMLAWIGAVPDVMRQPFLVRELAELFRVDENFLLRQLAEPKATKAPKATVAYGTSGASGPSGSSGSSGSSGASGAKSNSLLLPSERQLLQIALTEEHGLALLLNEFQIESDKFITDSGKRIYQRITIAEHEHSDVAQYVVNDQDLTTDERSIVADIIASTTRLSERWSKFDVDVPELNLSQVIEDSLQQLEVVSITEEINAKSRSMHDVSDLDERQRIALELQRLIERRNELHGKTQESN